MLRGTLRPTSDNCLGPFIFLQVSLTSTIL